MGSMDETAAAFETLIAEYQRVRVDLAAIRVDLLQARDELHGRLGNTQHPLILKALGNTTLATRRIEVAAAQFAAAIEAAREHAAALGLTLGDSGTLHWDSLVGVEEIADGDGRPMARRVFDFDAEAGHLPRYGENGAQTTFGRAVDDTGRTYEIHSGDKLRHARLIEATNRRLRERHLLLGHAKSGRASDVEQKFATWMRLEGVREADLVINNPKGPCRPRLGCTRTVPQLLDPGQRLTVHWRDANGQWQRRVFEGTP